MIFYMSFLKLEELNQKHTFDKQLSGAFFIPGSNSICCIIVHGAVIDDHNSLCALMLKNIPKYGVHWLHHWSPKDNT